MRYTPWFAALLVVTASPATAAPTPVTLQAADGVRVAGAYYRAPHPKALILLFHQAGSGKGEYATIAPRLVAAGYSALAIDQRSGGSLFGRNATVARLGHSASFADAARDLEAAFDWGRQQHVPVIVWGSSYSSALAFQLAAAHPGMIRAVLAFSPGEYLGSKGAVAEAARRIAVPIYATSASDADEIAAARTILAASPSQVKTQYVPATGVHGSSTLLASRNPKGAAANWRSVLDFLSSVSR